MKFLEKLSVFALRLIIFMIFLFIFLFEKKVSYGNDAIYLVTDKGINEGEYMIYTDRGTNVVKDSYMYGQFSSADIYGGLIEGRCYMFLRHKFTYRIPMFSMFPNVIKYKEVDCN